MICSEDELQEYHSPKFMTTLGHSFNRRTPTYTSSTKSLCNHIFLHLQILIYQVLLYS